MEFIRNYLSACTSKINSVGVLKKQRDLKLRVNADINRSKKGRRLSALSQRCITRGLVAMGGWRGAHLSPLHTELHCVCV